MRLPFPKHTTVKYLGIKSQLSVLYIAGILLLGLATTIITTWITNGKVRDLQVENGLKITEGVARHSLLALLYESPENAADAAKSALSFDYIRQVVIYDASFKPLLNSSGEKSAAPIFSTNGNDLSKPVLFNENEQNWFFMSPVLLLENQSNKSNLPNSQSQKSKILGYVYIVISKATLAEIRNSTMLNNSLVAAVLSIVLIVATHFILGHFLQPLSILTATMERAKDNTGVLYTGKKGAREIRIIANTFNTMMRAIMRRDNQLRNQNANLESLVKEKTRELVQARDKAIEANRHKSEFLANVTHELRTPLQSVIGYSDVLLEAFEDEGLFDYADDLERIVHNAHHLLGLINTILDLSKIESGEMQLNLANVDLKELLDKIEDVMRPLVSKNNNKLVITGDLETASIYIDGARFMQIVINIAGNAAKFTESGTITIHMKSSERQLEVSIEDTGIGISPEQQQRIFEPFVQADGSTTRQYHGTGLGLSISRKLCELMQGEIALHSQPGVGSTFIVTIPLPQNGQADSSNENDNRNPQQIHKYNV